MNDINSKSLDNLQYIVRDNKGDISLLGDKIWGNQSSNGIIEEIQCPRNSAIYKMEAQYNYYTGDNSEKGEDKGGIKGISIYCKDLVSGEPVELDKNYIGVKPDISLIDSKLNTVFCDGKSYFDEIGCNYDSTGINTLIFNKCKNIK